MWDKEDFLEDTNYVTSYEEQSLALFGVISLRLRKCWSFVFDAKDLQTAKCASPNRNHTTIDKFLV